MKKLIFIFTTIVFLNCKTEESTYKEMKSDELMSEFFTNSELKDLAKIVDFFESEVFLVSKEKIVLKYNRFLKKDSAFIFNKSGGLQSLIDYKNQKELYEKLDKSFFKSFWIKSMVKTQNPNNDRLIKSQYYHLKVFDEQGYSRYSKFLKILSKKNTAVENYYNGVELMNDFGEPGTLSALIYNHNHFDKRDIKNRLIYAFHYLNINEEHIKTEKYFNEIINSTH